MVAAVKARHGRIDLGSVGDVASKSLSLATSGHDAVSDFLGGFQVHVEHRHLSAFFGKAAAGGPTNTAAATGHNRCFAFEVFHDFLRELKWIGKL